MKKIIKIIQCCLFLIVLLGFGVAQADGDAKAGKSKSEICQGCHGEKGISIDPSTFPHLAGQFEGYIVKQVKDFQSGKRNDDTMSAMAATVTEMQDLKDIAAYFAAQKQMQGKGANKKGKGSEIFANGIPKSGVYACSACHGKAGKGKSADNSLFPVIGGQSKAYLIKQLKDLKSGTRTNDPAGMMADIARKLSDNDIESIAEYVSGL